MKDQPKSEAKEEDKMFIDGDFNNSYEARVKKATGKNMILSKEEYNKMQEEITRLKAELESLKILKDATKKGSEIYANLRFDDEPFTPYQLALQEIEKLKAELEKERELRKELVDSLHALLKYSRRWLDEYTNEIIQSLIEKQKDL